LFDGFYFYNRPVNLDLTGFKNLSGLV